MADTYDDYSREQLVRLLRERDRRPICTFVRYNAGRFQDQNHD